MKRPSKYDSMGFDLLDDVEPKPCGWCVREECDLHVKIDNWKITKWVCFKSPWDGDEDA